MTRERNMQLGCDVPAIRNPRKRVRAKRRPAKVMTTVTLVARRCGEDGK